MEHLVPIVQTSQSTVIPVKGAPQQPTAELADLRPFWGTDICRLEYLLYLMDSGRIKGN